jgi:hypothetical protein
MAGLGFATFAVFWRFRQKKLQLSLGRERNELLALTGEKRINIHEEGSDAPLDARGESRFKFIFSAGFNDEELAHERVGRHLDLFCIGFRIGIRRVYQQGDH